jgi:hypothetical protein
VHEPPEGQAGVSFRWSFHLALLRLSGTYWLDDASDLTYKDSVPQHPVDGWRLSCKQQVPGSSPGASSKHRNCSTHLWCIAVLRRFRVEGRASGEASSVMAGAEVGGWSVLGRGRLGADV